MMQDTIFALSSGAGASGVAVIRISGSNLSGFMARILNQLPLPNPLADATDAPQRAIPAQPTPPAGAGVNNPLLVGGETCACINMGIRSRHAYFCNLTDDNGELIDQVIAVYFAAPASFTGEDVIEIHSHGARAVIEKVFEFLRAQGFRSAQPGEFTRRAFDNNKMDLVEVDGLAALLSARTDAQRRHAMKSVAGADSGVYESWRAQMLEIAAYSAVMLDYPSDELPADIDTRTRGRMKKLHDEISNALRNANASRAITAGFNIVLVGPVNAGKSSLFNRIVGESRAIVSDVPGTTRDVVSAEIDIDGYLVRIADTAGLRDTNDAIEKIGIDRTNAEIMRADLVIRVHGADNLQTKTLGKGAKGGRTCVANALNEIIVYNKSDLTSASDNLPSMDSSCIKVSALTGDGITELLGAIKSSVHSALDGAESDVVASARARESLMHARDELALALSDENMPPELFAEHAQSAADYIGQILGVIGAAEIYDTVFSQLCLGK